MERWRTLSGALVVTMLLSVAVAGCGGDSLTLPTSEVQQPQTRLVFVVSSDIAHNVGDINASTANLSNQGLQRALLLASYLRTTLLGGTNVDGIYALEPSTRLQTANSYPDLVPLEIIEQFALLNQYSERTSLPTAAVEDTVANSFPINLSYTRESLPAGAATPQFFAPIGENEFQGIDFADAGGSNEILIDRLVAGKQGGLYVLALPFETLQSLLGRVKSSHAYAYDVPASWQGPNVVYMLTLLPHDQATLTAHDANLSPGTGYPTLTQTYQSAPNQQAPTVVLDTATIGGSSVPAGMNTNQTVYFVRHAEAHPVQTYEDGNMVLQGDWRALFLPAALAGKIKRPDRIYSCDPSFPTPGAPASGNGTVGFYSYVRVSQTVAPYAIANGIPFYVPTSFPCVWMPTGGATDLQCVQSTVDYFFTGHQFDNKTLLVSWEHDHIVEIGQNIMARYFVSNPSNAPHMPAWASSDYDTVWAFSLDGNGQLTFTNQICEGIDSASLPTTPPTFLP